LWYVLVPVIVFWSYKMPQRFLDYLVHALCLTICLWKVSEREVQLNTHVGADGLEE